MSDLSSDSGPYVETLIHQTRPFGKGLHLIIGDSDRSYMVIIITIIDHRSTLAMGWAIAGAIAYNSMVLEDVF